MARVVRHVGPPHLGMIVALTLGHMLAGRVTAAEESAGTRAAGFLVNGAPASVLAMGGATLALGRDVNGAAWNPAALGWLGSSQFAVSHASLADASAQEWIAGGGRIGSSATRFGASLLVLDEGTIQGLDASNHPTGDFRAQDLAMSLQLAQPVGPHASVGGAARWVRQSIADVSGNGLAFDLGGQLRSGPLAVALAGRNFGGGMRWDGAQWRMPASFGLGVALEPSRVPVRLALDWEAPADYYRSLRVGAEWRWRDRLALRGGWRGELGAPAGDRLGGPAFGFGAGAGPWWVDYGYVVSPDGTGSHRFGLNLRGRQGASTPSAPQPARPGQHPEPETVPSPGK
jgi:hypothetical protein